ncbi:MAG: CHAT domain-containing protein [Anaerolineae bacterium]
MAENRDHKLIEFILSRRDEIRGALAGRWLEFLDMLRSYLRDRASDAQVVREIRRALRQAFPEVQVLFEAWLAGQADIGGDVTARPGTLSGDTPEPAPPPAPAPEGDRGQRLQSALDRLADAVGAGEEEMHEAFAEEEAAPAEEAFEEDAVFDFGLPPPVAANGGSEEPEPETETVETFASLRGEDYAYLGQPYRLTVKLSDQRQETGGAHVFVPAVHVEVEHETKIMPMQVKLYAPDFELAPGEPGWLRDIDFYVKARASDEVTYTLLAQDRLEERYFAGLKVQYLVEGQVIGEASRRVEVLRDEAVAKTPPANFPPAPGYPLDERGEVRLPPVFTPVVYRQGDAPVHLTITIEEGQPTDRLRWDVVSPYLAESDFPPGPYLSRNLGAEEFVKVYLAPFGMPGNWPEDHMDTEGHIKPGSIPLLFQNLIELRNSAPAQFWALYQTVVERHQAAGHTAESLTVLLRTADTHIPWELMPVSEEVQDGKMPPLLGSAHRVGRWLLEVGTPAPEAALELRGFALAAPTYSDNPLPEAQAEQAFIKSKYDPYLIEDSIDAFRSFMQSGQPTGGAGIVHYAGHGDCCTDPMKGNWLVLTDGQAFFDVRSASNDLGNRLGKLGPTLAFFNACNVGRAAPGPLGSNGGWGRALLHQQYQGYIGPLWSVFDRHARDISQTFYTLALDEGLPLGEVMRRIRARFSEDNRLFTYLAYLYLGHPLAEIRYTPFEGDIL